MVFWAIFVLFLTLAVDALAIPGAGRVTDFLFAWVPRAVGAAVIFLVGWLVANFLGEGALIAAVNAGVPEARLLARAVRWGVLLFASATRGHPPRASARRWCWSPSASRSAG